MPEKSQTIQETEEVWLFVLGLRIFITFHQGETTKRNENYKAEFWVPTGKDGEEFYPENTLAPLRFKKPGK